MQELLEPLSSQHGFVCLSHRQKGLAFNSRALALKGLDRPKGLKNQLLLDTKAKKAEEVPFFGRHGSLADLEDLRSQRLPFSVPQKTTHFRTHRQCQHFDLFAVVLFWEAYIISFLVFDQLLLFTQLPGCAKRMRLNSDGTSFSTSCSSTAD